MSEVVLMQLPVWSPYSPPLGLALLKSYLAERGVSATVMDVNVHAAAGRDETQPDYWDMAQGYNYCVNADAMRAYYDSHERFFREWMDRAAAENPAIIGFSCFAANLHVTKLFLADMKQHYPHIRYVLGGPEVASFMGNADELLAEGMADAICLDEGEVAMEAYVREVRQPAGKPMPGLTYVHDGRRVPAGELAYVRNLDELPFPDYDDLDLGLYKLKGYLPSYATRGCLNKCVYCSARGFMKRFRYRTAERMYAEVLHLKECYPDTVFIRMADNISNGHIGELEKFCDLMIEHNPGVQWNLENAVIRKEMRTPLYKKLKAAGCTLLGYGLETPSPHLLERIGKRLSKGVDLVKVLQEGKEAGLYVVANVMFGLPGETEQEFDYLLDFMAEHRDALDMINPSLTFCEFYPGSLGAEHPEEYGLDLGMGTLFWKTVDGTNTYPVRMRRFERFCKRAKEYGLDNLFQVDELPNKHELLFRYYVTSGEQDKALACYGNIPQADLSAELRGMREAL
ncbi:B12-binding domain-containing radical SAM protein [Salidesulfovibrio brasiliensis]|uniref:B12-binding domain-containing radical SAM protein n=1 Tax=Salidesulfovibrio brasiliensis TaxID=221711 RepID=UPI0006CF4309|nr:radical SAM protein [Salidesulfovibrio brasiliensis]